MNYALFHGDNETVGYGRGSVLNSRRRSGHYGRVSSSVTCLYVCLAKRMGNPAGTRHGATEWETVSLTVFALALLDQRRILNVAVAVLAPVEGPVHDGCR